jgi:hypothetical protein
MWGRKKATVTKHTQYTHCMALYGFLSTVPRMPISRPYTLEIAIKDYRLTRKIALRISYT